MISWACDNISWQWVSYFNFLQQTKRMPHALHLKRCKKLGPTCYYHTFCIANVKLQAQNQAFVRVWEFGI